GYVVPRVGLGGRPLAQAGAHRGRSGGSGAPRACRRPQAPLPLRRRRADGAPWARDRRRRRVVREAGRLYGGGPGPARRHRRHRGATQLEEIRRALTSELDPQELLGKVAEAVLGVLDLDGVAVWMREGRDGGAGKITDSAGQIALPIGTRWDLHEDLVETLI